MNKFFSALFTVLILLSAVTMTVSAATPSLTAKYNNSTSGAEEFEVEISLKNNPGLNGIMISAHYDPTVLSLVSTANGGLFKTIFTTSQTLSVEPYKIMWITTDQNFEEITEDGILVTYVFKVNDNAPIEKTNLNFEIVDFSDNKNTKTMNFDNTSITINIKKDKVSLAGQETVTGTVDKTTATSSKNTATTSSGNNSVTSKSPSSISSASSVNSTTDTSSSIITQNGSLSPTQPNSSDSLPANGQPQEGGKEALSLMPIIYVIIVIVGAGIIGAVTLLIKKKSK